MVPVRGSPYKSSFNATAQPNANTLTGPAMTKYISGGLEEIHSYIMETMKGAQTKDKELTDVKTLISIKDSVESTFTRNDQTILELDSLDEALKFFCN